MLSVFASVAMLLAVLVPAQAGNVICISHHVPKHGCSDDNLLSTSCEHSDHVCISDHMYLCTANGDVIEFETECGSVGTTDLSSAMRTAKVITSDSCLTIGGLDARFYCEPAHTDDSEASEERVRRQDELTEDDESGSGDTASPTSAPTMMPTIAAGEPTPSPSTAMPSASPTPAPSSMPTASPTMQAGEPTPSPSTAMPSASPTPAPSSMPTASPTMQAGEPTPSPSTAPTMGPTTSPTPAPSMSPSDMPSAIPTPSPTMMSDEPTPAPSVAPTGLKSDSPTHVPTDMPTEMPTISPTSEPTVFFTIGTFPVEWELVDTYALEISFSFDYDTLTSDDKIFIRSEVKKAVIDRSSGGISEFDIMDIIVSQGSTMVQVIFHEGSVSEETVSSTRKAIELNPIVIVFPDDGTSALAGTSEGSASVSAALARVPRATTVGTTVAVGSSSGDSSSSSSTIVILVVVLIVIIAIAVAAIIFVKRRNSDDDVEKGDSYADIPMSTVSSMEGARAMENPYYGPVTPMGGNVLTLQTRPGSDVGTDSPISETPLPGETKKATLVRQESMC